MLSKLTNGLTGTWESLDERERMLLLVGVVYGVVALLVVVRAPFEREKKRTEMRELADMIAEKLK